MIADTGISRHYASGNLLERLEAALREDGADPATPNVVKQNADSGDNSFLFSGRQALFAGDQLHYRIAG